MGAARYLIIALFSALIVALLRRATHRSLPTATESVVLRYAWPMRAFMTVAGLAFIAFGIGGAVGIVGGADESRVVQVLLSSPLAVFGIYVLLECHLVSIAVDGNGLTHRSPWRRTRVIPWSDVRGARRSFMNEWIVIETRQGPIRVSEFIVGALALEQRARTTAE